MQLQSGNTESNLKVTAGAGSDSAPRTYKTVILKPYIVDGKNILTQDVISEANTKYIIKYDFDLDRKDITIPDSCILEFDGGSISGNGTGKDTITGTNTQIIACKKTIFTDITITGTWNISDIYSIWFADIHNVNKISNLFALSDADIQNNIYIEEGTYLIQQEEFGDTPFVPKSNTRIILNGVIQEVANSLTDYFTVDINNVENVCIEGSGYIKGDKDTHTGTGGEKVHGIAIRGSRNVTIKGLRIQDCWGDCIYIGTTAANYDVIIDGCFITNGRRQGISVVNAIGYEIKNCIISNIAGTAPEYGIDIEPNAGGAHHCYNGIIENCRFDTAKGIYIQSTTTQDTQNLIVRNNTFLNCNTCVTVSGGFLIDICNNKINGINTGIGSNNVENVNLSLVIRDNLINVPSGATLRCSSKSTEILSNECYGMTLINTEAESSIIKDNKLFSGRLVMNGKGCSIVNNFIEYAIECNVSCSIIDNTINDYVYSIECLVKDNTINIGTLHEARQYAPIVSLGSIISGNKIVFNDEPDSRINGLFSLIGATPSKLINNIVENAPRVYSMTGINVNGGVHVLIDNDFASDTSIYNYANVKDKIKVLSHIFHSITRPSVSEYFKGIEFYDRTLGKPIWWNGTAWVDATGTAV